MERRIIEFRCSCSASKVRELFGNIFWLKKKISFFNGSKGCKEKPLKHKLPQREMSKWVPPQKRLAIILGYFSIVHTSKIQPFSEQSWCLLNNKFIIGVRITIQIPQASTGYITHPTQPFLALIDQKQKTEEAGNAVLLFVRRQ